MITIRGTVYYEIADSIDPAALNNLPFTPDAYLGYVDGRWPDFSIIQSEHQNKPVYGLTTWGNPNMGDGSDDEPGNTAISQTPAITAGEIRRGIIRPLVYCPASWATQMVQVHTAAGIVRSAYRLVTAHYGGPTADGAPIPSMHICGPGTCGYGPGADGTQWESTATYDRTLCVPDFLTVPATTSPIPSHPGPQTTITVGDTVQAIGFSATTDAAGWTATGITLPAGKTKDDVISISPDGASPYDNNAADPWEAPTMVVDFGLRQPGTCRVIIRGNPNHFYSGRVFVAV